MFYVKCIATTLDNIDGQDLSSRFVGSVSHADYDFCLDVGSLYIAIGLYYDGINARLVVCPVGGDVCDVRSVPAVLFDCDVLFKAPVAINTVIVDGDMLLMPPNVFRGPKWFESFLDGDSDTVSAVEKYLESFCQNSIVGDEDKLHSIK